MRRQQNQKNTSGSFIAEKFGTEGKRNIPMKTSSGSQFVAVNGVSQAVRAIPNPNKSTSGR